MIQYPPPGSFHLHWAGDLFEVSLVLHTPRPGRAVFRTNIGRAEIHRRERIASTESGEPVLHTDWHDIPMHEVSPGHYSLRVPLVEVGIFSGKACFFPEGRSVPDWPGGDNLRIKVEPVHTACGNTMYTAFVRQFGNAACVNPHSQEIREAEQRLDRSGYTVIPSSGTFRDLIARLDTIMGTLRFRILQLLPIFPVPTTYARMGRFGSAFAALDFLSVDPSLAVFDTHATPLDQFRELADAVHSRGGTLYLDLPANHTGWASTLQMHHPEWFHKKQNGEFVSPGAWGVVWADLVELDYSNTELRAFMADVFLFWCRQGVDGFRCDAGYMIPEETWTYIVARVREIYPDTVFLLEGLGGRVETTERLLSTSNLNWAYSELFQTKDRGAMEWYLPRAIALSERCGPLIHFAETHDNNRLAEGGEVYAKMRVALSALLSHEGAFGIANGVEWFAREKIDVHGASSLNWGAARNQISEITLLNTLLARHPSFGPGTRLKMIQNGGGDVLAVLREQGDRPLLVLVNFNCQSNQTVHWPADHFTFGQAWDLLSGKEVETASQGWKVLGPGEVCCLTTRKDDRRDMDLLANMSSWDPFEIAHRRRNLMALNIRQAVSSNSRVREAAWSCEEDPDELGTALAEDPVAFCAAMNGTLSAPCTLWEWPHDLHRQVIGPYGFLLLILADHPFRAELFGGDDEARMSQSSVQLKSGRWALFFPSDKIKPTASPSLPERRIIKIAVFTPQGVKRQQGTLLALPTPRKALVQTTYPGPFVRRNYDRCLGCYTGRKYERRAFTTLHTVLSNGAGAMSYVRAAWGSIRSQYDCLLGLNPNPLVPADKRIFWTRCRAWLQFRGYSQAIDHTCMSSFSADPAGRFAVWTFKVPCGMGKWVPIEFRLDIAPGENRVQLSLLRNDLEGALDREDEITLVLRPDIEWRSFHQKTKAFLGAERAFPAAVKACGTGFRFLLQDTPDDLGILLGGSRFHQDAQWSYMVPHPEEGERGLANAGDLFSPGWFELPLKGGEGARMVAGEKVSLPFIPMTDEEPAITKPVGQALSEALSLYIVRRDALKTVIAGYPWFLDWGRDTLIVLRGIIADNRREDALAILREFGRFEERGTLPNIIHGQHVGNRDTSDAPLWFCVAARDLVETMGAGILETPCGNRSLKEVIRSILVHYRDGTPNGVKMDPSSKLIFSPSHFTWMDTNYPAGTPREGYPVEIQALWIAALRLAAKMIDPAWSEIADQATLSLRRLFALPGGGLADALRAKPGTPAARAEKEDVIRPNQLFCVTLDVFPDRELSRNIVQSCTRLVVPGAIRSAADLPVKADMGIWSNGMLLNDPHAPYRGSYRGDEDTQRKPAYHNGTAWSWPFPVYVEARAKAFGPQSRESCMSMLVSAVDQINAGGCACHIAEIFDGDAPHFARGCSAQAWGISELLRVWKFLSK